MNWRRSCKKIENEHEGKIFSPFAESSEQSLVQTMSQVSFKGLEIVGLWNQNKNLKILSLKREKQRKSWQAKCKELQDKNDKLSKQVTGQFPMQGGNDIIWDVVIYKENKLRPCLDYILDKQIVIKSAKQSVTVVKERLNKNPI